MPNFSVAAAVNVLAVVGVVSTASADVQLTLQGGHVTLVAKNATVRQILAEWERVGQTKVINAERVAGGPLTLQLTDVPERQALDIVLRSISGVILAPRTTSDGNVSAFERIVVIPASIAPASSTTAAPPPVFAQPAPFPQQAPPFPGEDDRGQGVTLQNPGGAVFAFPPPQVTNPQQGAVSGAVSSQPQQPLFPPQGAPAALPTGVSYPGPRTSTPVGVSVPGMVVPAPAPQPGQPGFLPPGFPPPPRPQNQ